MITIWPSVKLGARISSTYSSRSRCIGCSLNDHGLAHAGPVKSSNQGRIFSSIAWHTAVGPRPLWRTSIKWGQTNVGATLIDDDELAGIQMLELFSPGCSGLFVAFSGAQRLFFRVQPTRLIARLMVDVLTATACCSCHIWQWASNVASGWASN